MPRAKKAAAETAEVKETIVAATETPVAEKEAPAKKAAAKKPAAKKPAAETKAPANTVAEERKVVIQYNGAEITCIELINKAKAVAGIDSAKKVEVYVRPEINKVFYVINGDVFGDFEL